MTYEEIEREVLLKVWSALQKYGRNVGPDGQRLLFNFVAGLPSDFDTDPGVVAAEFYSAGGRRAK